VAILLPQCPEVMITHFAAMKLGAIVLPLFTLFGSDALAFRLSDSGAKAVVTDAENLGKVLALKPGLPDLAEVYATGPAAAPVRAFWSEIEVAAETPARERVGAEDPAVLIFTPTGFSSATCRRSSFSTSFCPSRGMSAGRPRTGPGSAG
jgi:acetyl-CoA synthetase